MYPTTCPWLDLSSRPRSPAVPLAAPEARSVWACPQNPLTCETVNAVGTALVHVSEYRRSRRRCCPPTFTGGVVAGVLLLRDKPTYTMLPSCVLVLHRAVLITVWPPVWSPPAPAPQGLLAVSEPLLWSRTQRRVMSQARTPTPRNGVFPFPGGLPVSAEPCPQIHHPGPNPCAAGCTQRWGLYEVTEVTRAGPHAV